MIIKFPANIQIHLYFIQIKIKSHLSISFWKRLFFIVPYKTAPLFPRLKKIAAALPGIKIYCFRMGF